MLDYIDFTGLQMKPLLINLIHQTILPLNENTMNITPGDTFGISFDNIPFTNYLIVVTSVSFTNFNNLNNKDMFENGFIYKPSFVSFMRNFRSIEADTSIVKIDFELVECEEV